MISALRVGSGSEPAAELLAARHQRTASVPRVVLLSAQAAVILLPMIRPTGPGNSSPVDLAIAAAIATFLLWAGWSGIKLRAPYWGAWSLLIAGGVVGALAGGRPGPALLDVAQDLVLMLWVLALVNTCRYPDAFRVVIRTWAVAAPVWAGVLVVAYFGHIDAVSGVTARLGVRAGMLFADPNMAANYWSMSAMVVAATKYPARRSLRVLAYIALALSIVFSGSNGGAFYLALATFIVIIGWGYRRFGMQGAIGLACAGILMGGAALNLVQPQKIQAWAVASNVPLLRDSFGRADQSLGQRTQLVNETLALLDQGGLWGLGPNTTIDNLRGRQQANFVHEAHDDYIEALVERGVIGFAGIFLLVGSVVVRARAVSARELAPGYSEALPNRVPLIAALLGFAASATFYQVLHFRHGWALLGLLAALHLWGYRPAGEVARR
ncbi:MAG: O-antigen ligase family protein [Candidatus Dormibacteraeota bacterium]|nr:O-antigen ligase family protein [Candidatus Dormibacteraeota bacterium]